MHLDDQSHYPLLREINHILTYLVMAKDLFQKLLETLLYFGILLPLILTLTLGFGNIKFDTETA